MFYHTSFVKVREAPSPLRHLSKKTTAICNLATPPLPKAMERNHEQESILSAELSTNQFSFSGTLLKYLLTIVDEAHALLDAQQGFWANHSTMDYLMEVVKFVTEILEVRKDFDRIWHEGMMYKLLKKQRRSRKRLALSKTGSPDGRLNWTRLIEDSTERRAQDY